MPTEEPIRPQLLQQWDEALAAPPDQMLEHLIRDLEKECLIEEAWARFRRSSRFSQAPWAPWRKRLEVRAGIAKARRQQREQLDSDRCLLRVRYARVAALKDLHPGAFHALLLEVLSAAGLDIAQSLEKSPRPLVALGHPLPLGAEGLGEWADATLNRPPGEAWLAAANAAAPPGLTLLEGTVLPPYALSALELSTASEWYWPVPDSLRGSFEPRVSAFLQASSFEIEKSGKVGGQKTVKRIEVRGLVAAMAWEPGGLAFTTRIAHGEALNPARLLAGVLGLEAAAIEGLQRRGVALAPDPRLKQQDRFAPKLKNIFEDAVLLGAGGNITLVDEDDDEPLVLGDELLGDRD
ncbi:MAG: DUF2344 domain-containing protein [Holophagaceae bacterium]|nr:DUF2344 domain-containing protein [Holophagaceae bacterium]